MRKSAKPLDGLEVFECTEGSAIKNAILVIAFQTPQHFTYFG